MAKRVVVETKNNITKIIVDGNEISDVVSYALSAKKEITVLNLEIVVTDQVSALCQ